MLPIELIAAMPAAAAAPLSSAVGIVQNTPWTPSRKNRPTASAPIAATGPMTVLATNAAAATASETDTTALALARAVAVARDDDHADDRDRVRDRGHEALGDVADPVDLVDHLADPEREAVDVDDHREVEGGEHEHAPVLEHLADRVALALSASLLALERGLEPRFSSASSHFASCGPSGSLRKTSTPATIAGIASSRNSHCQSSRPATPPITDMIPPEIGRRSRRRSRSRS